MVVIASFAFHLGLEDVSRADMETREIVIWAHSECRSTMSLFREIMRLAGVPVTISLWKYGQCDDVRQRREVDGQRVGEYDDLGLIPIGEDYARGRALLARHLGEGVAHIFCVYQVSPVYRRLIAEAKSAGCKVFVYAQRLGCFKEADVEAGVVGERGVGSAVAYMWLCFDRDTWLDPNTKTELEWVP